MVFLKCFRDVISKFAPEVNMLAKRLLKLISMGLGLEEDYLTGDLSGGPIKMVFNYYPPCPDPSLTLGLPKHCDPNLITLLLQGTVRGLQVIHDGQWIPVDPLPNTFTVNFGILFEVMQHITYSRVLDSLHYAVYISKYPCAGCD